MQALLQLATLGDGLVDAVQVINTNKRSPVYRSFMYDKNEVGNLLLQRAQSHIDRMNVSGTVAKAFANAVEELADFKTDCNRFAAGDHEAGEIIKYACDMKRGTLPAWARAIEEANDLRTKGVATSEVTIEAVKLWRYSPKTVDG